MKRSLMTLSCVAALSVFPVAGVLASEVANPPEVDYSALPPLGKTWRDSNPYRGEAAAFEIGRSAYNQTCARCHGADAATNAAPAPDLRNLDRTCRRIQNPLTKAHCVADNDAYYAKTVQNGKVIVGVMHMPPWRDVLPQEVAWAIQVFIEKRAAEKAATQRRAGQ